MKLEKNKLSISKNKPPRVKDVGETRGFSQVDKTPKV